MAAMLLYGPRYLRARTELLMAFRVPAMPLAVNIWRNATGVLNPPDLITVGNLAWGRRVTAATGIPGDPGEDTAVNYLLVTALTDIRDNISPGGPDVVELPAGTLRYYYVKQVDDVGKGFANEFRVAVIAKLTPWPAPIP